MKMIKLFAIAAVMTGLLASCGEKKEEKKGEIKEIGSHHELLKKGGFYAKLHQVQFEKKASVV